MNREELFDKHLRGELSAEETRELKTLLASDAAAAKAFVEYVGETALLIRVGSQLESARPGDNIVPLEADHASPRRWKVAALAACLVVAATIAVLVNRWPRSSPVVSDAPVVHRVVYVTGDGVRVARGGQALDASTAELQPGDVIAAGTNDLATIAYANSATRVVLQPGAVLVLGDSASDQPFELRAGIVHARVAPQPAGERFRMITAQARATVLGTEFLLRADEGVTRLDVLEGKVRFNCRASGKKVVVKGGFSATVLNGRASFDVTPLCRSNCLLRECRGNEAAAKLQTLKPDDEK